MPLKTPIKLMVLSQFLVCLIISCSSKPVKKTPINLIPVNVQGKDYQCMSESDVKYILKRIAEIKEELYKCQGLHGVKNQ